MLLVARREVRPTGERVQALVANEAFPSYELRARVGELLRVTVENQLDEPTAIHFHGLVVPNAMDGVPDVTQQPIAPQGRFVYELPLRESGTYFYESTVGLQRQLGLAGALVVAEREERHPVDHDTVVLLSDWTNDDPAEIVPKLRGPTQTPIPGEPERPLNELPDGAAFPIDVRYGAYLLNGRTHRDAWTKEASPGERLRLRLVNASAATFFRFMVERHALQVVAADGRPVELVEVDNLILAPGERYDVLLTMGERGSYTMRAAALGAPGGAVGVLHTPGARPVIATSAPKWGKRHLTYAALRATEDVPGASGDARRVRLVVAGDSKRYLWTVDGRSWPGLYTEKGADPGPPLELARGERVELEVVNQTDFWQPLHPHGVRFRLLAPGGARERAPSKDTLAVAPGKSLAIELVPEVAGRWLAPSTHLYRAESGLARLIEVR